MASDFKTPYMRSIWFPDVFNLADMDTLKNYNAKKLNLKSAGAPERNNFSPPSHPVSAKHSRDT